MLLMLIAILIWVAGWLWVILQVSPVWVAGTLSMYVVIGVFGCWVRKFLDILVEVVILGSQMVVWQGWDGLRKVWNFVKIRGGVGWKWIKKVGIVHGNILIIMVIAFLHVVFVLFKKGMGQVWEVKQDMAWRWRVLGMVLGVESVSKWVGEHWIRYKEMKEHGEEKVGAGNKAQRVRIFRTRQRTVWARWVREQGVIRWVPLNWTERYRTVVPDLWRSQVFKGKLVKIKGKYMMGGGRRMWDRIRSRAVGREWWGCIPRLSAADMALWLKIKNIDMKVLAKTQLVSWMQEVDCDGWAVVNVGNHWVLVQKVGTKKVVLWDTYGVAGRPKMVGKAIKDLKKDGLEVKFISTGVQIGSNDRTCGYTVLRWTGMVKKKVQLCKKDITQEGEVEATVNILEELHHKTGMGRGVLIARKGEGKTKGQILKDKKGFLRRMGASLVSAKQVDAVFKEWGEEELRHVNKRKDKRQTPKVREKWVNKKGDIWMMSMNIRGALLEKIPFMSLWLSKQETMPTVIAVQETCLIEAEKQQKMVDKVVNKWMPE